MVLEGVKNKFLDLPVGYAFIDGERVETTLRQVHSNFECIRILAVTVLLKPHRKLSRRLQTAYMNVHGEDGNRFCKPMPKYIGHGW